jgi:hypothetical protein
LAAVKAVTQTKIMAIAEVLAAALVAVTLEAVAALALQVKAIPVVIIM